MVLIELVRHTNERIRGELEALLADESYLENVPAREIEVELGTKTKLWAYLHQLLQFVEGADVHESPVPLIFPLRRVLDRFVKKFDLILRCTRTYNYRSTELREKGIAAVFEEAGYESELEVVPARFYLIECPVSEKKNVPLHCVLGHEISHFLYAEYHLGQVLPAAVQFSESEVQKLIDALSSARVETKNGGAEETLGELLQPWRVGWQVRKTLATIRDRWLEELCADAMALSLLGPAYLFAFSHFAGPSGATGEASLSHPPDRLRISFMCDLVLSKRGALGYGRVLPEAVRRYVEEWRAYCSEEVGRPALDGFYKLVQDAISPGLSGIASKAVDVVGKAAFTPAAYRRHVNEMAGDLVAGIPPDRVYDNRRARYVPANWAVVLNAAWVFVLTGVEEYGKTLRTSDRRLVRQRMSGLIAKGLDSSELLQKWRSRR